MNGEGKLQVSIMRVGIPVTIGTILTGRSIIIAGSLNQSQQNVIEYLHEENRSI